MPDLHSVEAYLLHVFSSCFSRSNTHYIQILTSPHEVEIMSHSHFKQILNNRFCQVYAICVHVTYKKKDTLCLIFCLSQLRSTQNKKTIKNTFLPPKKLLVLHYIRSSRTVRNLKLVPSQLHFGKKDF